MTEPSSTSLRPLLSLAADGGAFAALAAALDEAAGTVHAHVSSALRPYLLAAVLEWPGGTRRPGARRRS